MAEFTHPHLFLHSKKDLNNYGCYYYSSENTTFRNSEELLKYSELRLLSHSKYHYTVSFTLLCRSAFGISQTEYWARQLKGGVIVK